MKLTMIMLNPLPLVLSLGMHLLALAILGVSLRGMVNLMMVKVLVKVMNAPRLKLKRMIPSSIRRMHP